MKNDAQDGEHEDQLWCYCQEPEYGFMVKCDGKSQNCKVWYHGPRVNISQRKANKMREYICFNCATK